MTKKTIIVGLIGFQLGSWAQASFDRWNIKRKAPALIEDKIRAEAIKKASAVHNLHVTLLEDFTKGYTEVVCDWLEDRDDEVFDKSIDDLQRLIKERNALIKMEVGF